MSSPYIHGFSQTEQARLVTQARLAEPLVFRDIDFGHARQILEVGCGVGAQTSILLRRFPELEVTGVDQSEDQLSAARENLAACAWATDRYTLLQMNAMDLDFELNTFDGAYLCWVLEHIPQPARVLNEVRRVLRPGSRIFVTEVLNASFFLEPYSPNLWKYWMAFNDQQVDSGGDPFIGAKLGNLLLAAGYQQVETKVKSFHYDNRDPARRRAMISFWSDLLMSASDQLIASGRVTAELVSAMNAEVRRVRTDPNAVFFFSFVQARAER
jgi:ubiquinone/menaquinone biosynthesis C-methylase UbiE